MKLQPNDILQQGDIVRYNTGETRDIGGGSIGRKVETFIFNGHFERPDPEPDLREHVRILRDALEYITRRVEVVHPSGGTSECEVCSAIVNARAALGRTK